MVVIVSIICAAGFVGVLPIVLGLVVFGGGGSGSQTQQVLKDAENRVKATPDNIDALVSLAALYRGANKTQQETLTLQKAMGVGAKNNDELQLLLGGLAQQVGQRLQVLQSYTKAHPKDADAFLTYGQTAETVGQTTTARLAYQRAQQLAPKGSTLRQNATTALDRLKATPAAPTPVAPTPTATGPVTPGSPVTP
jgi:cytochrome c-type biogenesis protein CcmH/NrfG